jgi:hypothetical protein
MFIFNLGVCGFFNRTTSPWINSIYQEIVAWIGVAIDKKNPIMHFTSQ